MSAAPRHVKTVEGVPPEVLERPAAIARDGRIRANHQMLEGLGALWDQVPDQRFGQLVMNLSSEPGGFTDTWEWKHGDWRERIEEAYRTWAKP